MTTTKKRRRRPPAQPPAPAPMVPIRMTADLVERVDARRPALIPREPFIRQMLSDYLDQLEEQDGEAA